MLTVSTSPGLAAKWLVPRLEKFRERPPDLALRIDASMGLVDFAREDVHLALRYGRGRYPGLHTELLMRSEVFPVCAPGLLHGPRGLREPEDLQHHALIHDETLARDSSCPDWAMWLRAAGVTGIDPGRGVRFNQVALALDAAAAGRGVVLTRDIFAPDDLVAGRLVRPVGAGMRRRSASERVRVRRRTAAAPLALARGLELPARRHDVTTPRRADRRDVAGLHQHSGEGSDRVIVRALIGSARPWIERGQIHLRWNAGKQADELARLGRRIVDALQHHILERDAP